VGVWGCSCWFDHDSTNNAPKGMDIRSGMLVVQVLSVHTDQVCAHCSPATRLHAVVVATVVGQLSASVASW
jgi:hypothetical protein